MTQVNNTHFEVVRATCPIHGPSVFEWGNGEYWLRCIGFLNTKEYEIACTSFINPEEMTHDGVEVREMLPDFLSSRKDWVVKMEEKSANEI